MGCFYQSFWYKKDPGLENTSICSRPGMWPWGTSSQGTKCFGASGFSGFLGNIHISETLIKFNQTNMYLSLKILSINDFRARENQL